MKFDYPHGTRFKCRLCGLCCGDTPDKTRHVLILKTEAEKISDATKQPISKFTVKVEDKLPYVYEMAKTQGGVCVFLKANQCTIYALRPLVCRFYPFELKTNEAGTLQFIATDECLGLRKGRVMSEQNFRRLFRLARETVNGERRLSETWKEDYSP